MNDRILSLCSKGYTNIPGPGTLPRKPTLGGVGSRVSEPYLLIIHL